MARNYRRGFGRRRGAMSLNVINSIKNIHAPAAIGVTSSNSIITLAKAVTSPSPTVTSDVSHGCVIKAIWIAFDVCGLGGTGVVNVADMYIIKNPGANLTVPSPASVGSSNEKKFVFRQWRAMIMRNQDGNVPYHWEGWLKIPKLYQRMGTDDRLDFVIICTSGVTAHGSIQAIYKWFR